MRPEVVGKNPLPLCRNYFDMNIKCPTTRWNSNYQQNGRKKIQIKKRQMETFIDKGNQKCRNELEFVDTVYYSIFFGILYTVF